MTRMFERTAGVLCVVLLLGGIVTGCQESVDAIVGSDYPFTLWGFMNSGADTQYVRIFPILEELAIDTDSVIDARVYSTNLTTGEQLEWSYRTVRFGESRTGHVFWAPFRAEYRHRYLLEVVRSDGARSRVEVAVPPKADVDVDADGQGVTVPIRISGDAPNLVGPKVTYNTINVPPASAWPPGTPVHPPVLHPVRISYDDELARGADGWELIIDLTRDTSAIREEFRANCLITTRQYSAPEIWLRSMEFSVVVADSAWQPPGGVFDPDVLAVPGTLSNVVNGHGFFGAGEGVRYQWIPTPEARHFAGYRFEARCRMGPFDADECRNPPIPCIGENVDDLWSF